VQCTFYGNTADAAAAINSNATHTPSIDHTLIVDSSPGTTIDCYGAFPPRLTCCDLYGNAGGDWVGCVADQYGVDGNISADPLFCHPETGDFTLHADSPCAPEGNPECGLIGAWPVGCSATPVEEATWGSIKAMFRQ
jgi:hypothetical protein